MNKNYPRVLSAFTVIELLVVIAIISLLVVSIIFGYQAIKVRAKCVRVKSDFDAIAKAARLEWVSTNKWAVDVPTGTDPSFVPNYLATWPSASFYQKNLPCCGSNYDAMYDWEGWPDDVVPAPIKAISLRAPQSTPRNNDPNGHNNSNPNGLDIEFYYCVQDDQANPTECFWTTSRRNPPPTALNLGGNCPVQ